HNPRAFLVCHGFLLAPAPAGLIPPRLQEPERRSATDGAEMTALCATRVKNAGCGWCPAAKAVVEILCVAATAELGDPGGAEECATPKVAPRDKVPRNRDHAAFLPG